MPAYRPPQWVRGDDVSEVWANNQRTDNQGRIEVWVTDDEGVSKRHWLPPNAWNPFIDWLHDHDIEVHAWQDGGTL